MSTAEPPAAPQDGRPAWVRIGLGAAVIAAVVLLFVLLRGGDDDPAVPVAATGATTAAKPKPVAATPATLGALAEELDRPVYWVGPRPGVTYELTRTQDGSVYVRYLDRGAALGDGRPDFVTVGTYPQDDPLATVEDAARRDGARSVELPGGAKAVSNKARASSWYVAFPRGRELVEVYAPSPARARELVTGQRVVPAKG